jgi:hypothetical protein
VQISSVSTLLVNSHSNSDQVRDFVCKTCRCLMMMLPVDVATEKQVEGISGR